MRRGDIGIGCGRSFQKNVLERSVRRRVFQRKYDEEIKRIAQSGKIPYPKDFSEKVERYCENLPDGSVSETELSYFRSSRRRKYVPYFRYGLVAASIACFLLVIAPVSADLQGHWKRMVEMKGQEKERYVSELNMSATNGDSFSRTWTDSETKRLEKLTFSYEQGQTYPAGEITSVDAETEVRPDRVCFLAKSSTFYLPERELTDEQLLQIIDFQHKREYSLGESVAENGEGDEDLSVQGRNGRAGISRRNAIEAGVEWIETIYGKDVSAWECKVDKTDSSDGKFGAYRITFREAKTAEAYAATVRDTDGKIVGAGCVNNGHEEDMSEELSVGGKKELRKQYQTVKDLARKLDGKREIASGYCEYLKDLENGFLPFGNINFWLVYPDGTGWKITYSLNSREYRKFNYIEDISVQVGENNISSLESSTRKKMSVKFE